MLRNKLQRKGYIQVVFVFAAFALMAAIGGISIGNTIQKTSLATVSVALEETEKTIRAYLREPRVAFDSIYTAVQDLLDRGESQEVVQQYLNQTTELLRTQEDGVQGFITVFGYIRGDMLFGTPWEPTDGFVPQERPWYQTAIRSGGAEYTAPYIDIMTGLPIISMARELHGKDGEYYGVLALDVDISWLMGYAESLQFVEGGYGMIVSQHLYIIAHPREQLRNERLQDIGVSYAAIADMLRAGRSVSAERILDIDGRSAIIFFTQLYNGWHVGVVMPTISYYSDLNTNIALLAALGVILAVILSYILVRLSAERNRSEEESRSKSSFLAMMSHEMRTPMNAIIGMTNIAKSADSIERKDYALDRISDASLHLIGVINDILDMSKIEADKLVLHSVVFNVEDLLKNVINIINFRLVEKNHTFKVHIDDSIPRTLKCDNQRLSQILTNLLSNAIKFTPDHGTITLSANLLGCENGICEIKFDITDTGMGISEEQKTRLFLPFEQSESSTTRKYGGTGLGLPISKRIVELMGGTISVESSLGEGATFSFTIKAERSDETAERAAPSDDIVEADDFSGYRVLLVDDVDINREIVISLLEPTHIEVDVARNGVEAVRTFSKAPEEYNIIFMDIQMPEMDGYDATRAIRALNNERAKSIPIIAMTANIFKEDINNCLAAGMNDHLGKPLDINATLEILRKYLFMQTPAKERH